MSNAGKDMRPIERVSGTPFTTLFGLSFAKSESLAGCKMAVQVGNQPLYLSPAMFDLVTKAETQHELRQVLENIRVMHIPDYSREPLPMTTLPFA